MVVNRAVGNGRYSAAHGSCDVQIVLANLSLFEPVTMKAY